MRNPEGLNELSFTDLLGMSRKLGSGPKRTINKEFGNGLKFQLPTEPPSHIVLHPSSSTIQYTSEGDVVTLREMSKPTITQEGVIFQSRSNQRERYLSIGQEGEVVLLFGKNPDDFQEAGVPISPPPETYLPNEVMVKP